MERAVLNRLNAQPFRLIQPFHTINSLLLEQTRDESDVEIWAQRIWQQILIAPLSSVLMGPSPLALLLQQHATQPDEPTPWKTFYSGQGPKIILVEVMDSFPCHTSLYGIVNSLESSLNQTKRRDMQTDDLESNSVSLSSVLNGCRMLKFTLSDGRGTQIQAMEYRSIASLPADPPPGLKLRLLCEKIYISRNTLLLSEENCQVVGGCVMEWVEKERPLAKYKEKLGMKVTEKDLKIKRADASLLNENGNLMNSALNINNSSNLSNQSNSMNNSTSHSNNPISSHSNTQIISHSISNSHSNTTAALAVTSFDENDLDDDELFSFSLADPIINKTFLSSQRPFIRIEKLSDSSLNSPQRLLAHIQRVEPLSTTPSGLLSCHVHISDGFSCLRLPLSNAFLAQLLQLSESECHVVRIKTVQDLETRFERLASWLAQCEGGIVVDLVHGSWEISGKWIRDGNYTSVMWHHIQSRLKSR